MSYKDKEQIREQRKQYYQKNKEKERECRKRYYQENKRKERERGKRYYHENKGQRKWYLQENKELIREQRKQYYQENIEQRKQYYQENKEQIQEYGKRYQQENKEQIRERGKCYRQQNKEQRKYYLQENKEQIQEQKKRYRQENSEKCQESQRRYRQSPAGKIALRESYHKRRANLMSCQINDLTKNQVKLILDRAKKCEVCGRRFSEKLIKTLDHIQPISKGGYNTLVNIQIICGSCNSRKRDKDYTLYTNGQLLMFVGRTELMKRFLNEVGVLCRQHPRNRSKAWLKAERI